jgi:hypothetical protein
MDLAFPVTTALFRNIFPMNIGDMQSKPHPEARYLYFSNWLFAQFQLVVTIGVGTSQNVVTLELGFHRIQLHRRSLEGKVHPPLVSLFAGQIPEAFATRGKECAHEPFCGQRVVLPVPRQFRSHNTSACHYLYLLLSKALPPFRIGLRVIV